MISRYWNTVRHLEPSQIAYRVLRSLPSLGPSDRPPPPLEDGRGELVEPVRPEPAFEPPDRFRFMEREARIEKASDWSRNDLPLLWLYRLHYFHDLTARGAAARADELQALILRWIRENPPKRRPAWDPYPTSLRIVSWVKWSLLVRPLPDQARKSLARQARHLAANLEYQHRANHLLANGKALVFAGCFFGGAEGREWLLEGLRILREELPEQVLADGGHFERSPGYHALVLEDVLDTVNVLRCYGRPVPEVAKGVAGPMLAWARFMTHPDGGPAQLNDTTLDQGPGIDELEAYAARLGLEASEAETWERVAGPGAEGVLLPRTGYGRVEAGSAVAFLDMAPLGPDYNPAHGHADTLTFELSVAGRRVVVDPGVSTYEAGSKRSAQRGTRAHNTVCLDGRDSSEVWASFRVARRARVVGRRLSLEDGEIMVEAAHDGYLRQGIQGFHARRWRFGTEHMVVEDLLDGPGTRNVEVGFLFHPDARPALVEGRTTRLVVTGRPALQVELDPTLGWTLEAATWHPGFGRSLETVRLVGRARCHLPTNLSCRFSWADSP